jgi:hypothetical protein
MAVMITIRNLEPLRQAVALYPETSVQFLEYALDRSVDIILNYALPHRGIVPYKTTRMSQSFKEGIVRGNLFRAVGPTVDYAIYVDQGTRYIRPRLFMDKLAKASEPLIDKRFEEATDKIVQALAVPTF